MRALERQFEKTGEARIVIIYQKEPHSGQMVFKNIAQPETFSERCKLAEKMKSEFEMPMPVLVDTMRDESRALFTDLPSPVYILDSDGYVRAKFPWPDKDSIQKAVEEINGNVDLPIQNNGDRRGFGRP